MRQLSNNILMKRLIILLFSLLPLAAFAQKRVAILETVDLSGEVSYGVKMQVRSTLAYVISHNTGYDGYDRANVSVIFENPNFPRTGSISDAQVKELASVANATYVLIAEASLYDEQNLIISAKLLDGMTGNIANTARPVISGKTPDTIEKACGQLVAKLFENMTASSSKESPAIPEGYVDLELPSRTLWRSQNENRLYLFNDAIGEYGNKIPTQEQWLELKNSCKWVWSENGYKVIGRNGQSIFLGKTNIIACDGRGGYIPNTGCYWSSSPNSEYYAYGVRFDNNKINILPNESRCEGYAIRLVRPGGFVDLGLPSGTLWRDVNEEEGMTFDEAKKRYDSALPTKEQWQELVDECNWTWVDPGEWVYDEEAQTYWHIGDMPYYLVAGKNGNTIQIPMGGYTDVENNLCVGCGGIGGITGFYYTSNVDDNKQFYFIMFDEKSKDIANWDMLDQPYHLSIRLVYK